MDTNPNSEDFRAEEKKILLAKEELNVSKTVESQTRTFHKSVETNEVEIPVELHSEEISVERIPKNIEIENIPQTRTDGETLIIPVFEERAVVVKKLILVEEIHIKKSSKTETKVLSETIRRETFNEE